MWPWEYYSVTDVYPWLPEIHDLVEDKDKSAAAAAKSLQSCPTLCDPRDGSPPGSPIPGILQARILEWVAISFFNAWKWKVKGKSLSRVRLLVTPWTAAYQAPPSMGFSRQEYWSGLPSPSRNSATWEAINKAICIWSIVFDWVPRQFSRRNNSFFNKWG